MKQVTSQALQEVGIGTAEKASLQTTAENSQGWCRHDIRIVHSRHEQQQTEKHSRQQSTTMYDG